MYVNDHLDDGWKIMYADSHEKIIVCETMYEEQKVNFFTENFEKISLEDLEKIVNKP